MRRRLASAALAALVALTGCAAPSTGAQTTGVQIAAASSLKFALDALVADFQQANEGVQVSVSYGSSGTLVQQAANGAPFDVYLAAERSYVEQLLQRGLADRRDVFDYAVGRLVVWAAHDSPARVGEGLAGLADERVRTVAIANPAHAPYGAAAMAAMDSAGVNDRVEPKLVLGENIAQAAEFARSGNADAAVIALSLALAPTMREQGAHTEVPPEDFPRLKQSGAVLAGAPEAAHDLAAHLTSERGRQILADHGFHPAQADPEG